MRSLMFSLLGELGSFNFGSDICAVKLLRVGLLINLTQ